MGSSEVETLEKAGSLVMAVVRTVNFILKAGSSHGRIEGRKQHDSVHVLTIPSQLWSDLAMEAGKDRMNKSLRRRFWVKCRT